MQKQKKVNKRIRLERRWFSMKVGPALRYLAAVRRRWKDRPDVLKVLASVEKEYGLRTARLEEEIPDKFLDRLDKLEGDLLEQEER